LFITNDKTEEGIRVKVESKMMIKGENKKVKERSREREEEKKRQAISEGIQAYSLGQKEIKTYSEEQSCCVY
jgi:hypothetical protein